MSLTYVLYSIGILALVLWFWRGLLEMYRQYSFDKRQREWRLELARKAAHEKENG